MKIKFFITAIVFFIGHQFAFACEVCKKNQPAGFENITHGAGPSGTIDYVIIFTAAAVVLFTVYLTFKHLFRPCENSPEHIKNIVRNEGF